MFSTICTKKSRKFCKSWWHLELIFINLGFALLTAPCRKKISELKHSSRFNSCWETIRKIPLPHIRKNELLTPYHIQRLFKAEPDLRDCFNERKCSINLIEKIFCKRVNFYVIYHLSRVCHITKPRCPTFLDSLSPIKCEITT